MKSARLLLACCLLLSGGKQAGADDSFHNQYEERMQKLADEAKANPKDLTALHKLEQYTSDKDLWNRNYALGFLGQLAFLNIGDYREEILPYFDRALKDPDYGVRQIGVQAIEDIGATAVEKAFDNMLPIIRQGNEDDVTWGATAAVGKLEDRQKAQEILPILLKAASTPPPVGTPNAAPQLRYFALGSIKELAKEHRLKVVSALEALLVKSSSPFKERVAKTILYLDPNNGVAKEAIHSNATSR